MSENAVFDELVRQVSTEWHGLPDKPDEDPDITVRALWHCAAGIPRSVQHVKDQSLPTLDDAGLRRVRDLVQQRVSGVPLSYLTGRQGFMGLELMAGPEAVIPRKETEIVGQAALQALSELAEKRGSVRVIDVCTGSGNLALALAFYEPRCKVVGVDLSPEAAALAYRNALALGLSERVKFVAGDLFAPFETDEIFECVDMVTCNPPYISAARLGQMPKEIVGFEPRMAFDGGPFGVSVLTRLVREAPRFLKPDSWLCFEVGLGQGQSLERILRKTPDYSAVQVATDEQGEVRALLARTRPTV